MNFNENQMKAINFVNGNAVVLATAGSGKTTVLTNRIKNMIENHNVEPQSILAVTFSKKAKEAMSEKLKQLIPEHSSKVNVETFHSFALKIIRSKYGGKYKVWTAQWEKEKTVKDILVSMRLCDAYDNNICYTEIFSFIAMQKHHMLKPQEELIYPNDIPFKSTYMCEIYKKYESYKQNNSLIEFDDFLIIANDIFDTDKNILHMYQDFIKYVLADEYQDVSMPQAKLLKKLNTDNTMIVGDPLQAIYSFRGGSSKFILDFDRDYKNAKVINLNINYRCSRNIVDASNVFAQSVPDSKHRNYTESMTFNSNNAKPKVMEFKNPYFEGYSIAEIINSDSFKNKYKYSDTAVLARTNAQLQKIQSCFHEKKIPFETVEGTLFTEQPEIKLLISYLKLAHDENDNEAFEYVYNKPNRWLSKKFLEETYQNAQIKKCSLYQSMFSIARRNWRFKQGIDEIYEVINYLQNKKFKDVSEMIKYIRFKLPIDKFVSKDNKSNDGQFGEQTENINSFENICEKYKTLSDFVRAVDDLNKTVLNTDNSNKVRLLTIHKSKGLEFPAVFLIGCNNGLLPHEKCTDVNDEKRLMYVGITRAEKELYMSYCNFYNNKTVSISPFIKYFKDTVEIVSDKDISVLDIKE